MGKRMNDAYCTSSTGMDSARETAAEMALRTNAMRSMPNRSNKYPHKGTKRAAVGRIAPNKLTMLSPLWPNSVSCGPMLPSTNENLKNWSTKNGSHIRNAAVCISSTYSVKSSDSSTPQSRVLSNVSLAPMQVRRPNVPGDRSAAPVCPVELGPGFSLASHTVTFPSQSTEASPGYAEWGPASSPVSSPVSLLPGANRAFATASAASTDAPLLQ
mmetsp:Transcript_25103/g.80989  ORF Transcript_25103/g.80989 Transcript_25103/m.80989 type:complete len:214 (-) Transcript_25103:482-1123(-)